MPLLETAKNAYRVVRNLPQILTERREAIEAANDLQCKSESLQENLVELELALEDIGWRETGALGNHSWNFRRHAIRKMMDLSRRMYLINPLMRRSVDVQSLYIWALGFTVTAKSKVVQQVLDDFYEDPKNQAVLTSNPAWAELDRTQQILGNTFLALFYNPDTGACRARYIPVDQVTEIVSNPEDSKDIWYYKRVIQVDGAPKAIYYPDINYHSDDTPATFGEGVVEQNVCILHIKTGGLMEMSFGLPEHYSIFAWAIAYKKMLENWATIIQAYARMAMKVTGLAGKKGVAATKTKMGTGISGTGLANRLIDNNPPSNTAGWFAASGGVDIAAVKTAGATTSASEGKPLKDMVAAGAGIPSHFYGDSDSGNFATSTTLDRPTELKFVARQKLYVQVNQQIQRKLLLWSAQASEGRLSKVGASVVEVENPFDAVVSYTVELPAGVDGFIKNEFPSILERNVTERVRAAVAAITLNGSRAEGIIPDRKYAFELLLDAMGVENKQAISDQFYPSPVIQSFVDPKDELEVQRMKAQGTLDLGLAALDQAETAAKAATQKPKQGAGSNVGPVGNK